MNNVRIEYRDNSISLRQAVTILGKKEFLSGLAQCIQKGKSTKYDTNHDIVFFFYKEEQTSASEESV